MKKIFSLLFLCGCLLNSFAQSVGVGTTTPDASAVLDITSSDKGLLIPRINLLSFTDVVTIPNPTKGLLVFHNNKLTLDGKDYI
jgi:trimeric autotransporter adhesin